MDFRKCTKCNKKLPLRDFYKTPKGYRGDCKECCSLKNKKFRELNPSYSKKYNKEYNKEYYILNKDNILKMAISRDKFKNSNDLSYRIKGNLRKRARKAILNKGGSKSIKSLKLLGVSNISIVISYIESLFTEGMSWDNYGEWEFDHILPCSSFDLTQESEQLKCFNYKNLQPLWWEDNASKYNKI